MRGLENMVGDSYELIAVQCDKKMLRREWQCTDKSRERDI